MAINLLISNDDGINAKGINILAEHLRGEHNITVVAPHKNRSGASSALTLDRPLNCDEVKDNFYSVTGTPCDCVHLGTHHLVDKLPDMVIAGINHGANLGDDVMYSGTVAAAMEGRHLGIPSIALSLVGYNGNHFESAAIIMQSLLKSIKAQNLPSNIILNINVPDLPIKEIKGIKLTRLGCRHRADTIVPAEDPRGKKVYWIGPPSEPQDIGEGTDFFAVNNGYISITPLLVDFTATQYSNKIDDWLSQLNFEFK